METPGDVSSSLPNTAENEQARDVPSQPSAAPLSRQSPSGPNKPIQERDRVHAAWQSRFGVRQLSLTRDDPEPFRAERRLGGGGFGIVHQTSLDGIPLALKRTYPRKLSKEHLNEIRILGKVSEQRHRHIVELVGWYVHRQRVGYELGLLMWPVAQCDLAALLHDLSTLSDWYPNEDTSDAVGFINEDVSSALETISAIFDIRLTQISESSIFNVISRAKGRLMQTCGCIAEAVAYLHSQNIRHKDLKPSQILLSPKGLWLADFGWSNDMSDFSGSATSGWDRTTARYQAPERASRDPCGRSEDIFALGCIFFEMSAYVADVPHLPSPVGPWSQEGGSFQANLHEIYFALNLRKASSPPDYSIAFDQLLLQMLAKKPSERPTIEHILGRLSDPPFESCFGSHRFNWYSRPCCRRLTPPVSNTGQHIASDKQHDRQISSGSIGHLQTRPWVLTDYPSGQRRTGWGCGYCYYFETNWNNRFHHIRYHIEHEGETSKSWDSSNVIISLLERPILRTEWERILNYMRRTSVDFTWDQSSITTEEKEARTLQELLYRSVEPIDDRGVMCLQDALESFTPNDDAAALAQRAYDEAVKNGGAKIHSSLEPREDYREVHKAWLSLRPAPVGTTVRRGDQDAQGS